MKAIAKFVRNFWLALPEGGRLGILALLVAMMLLSCWPRSVRAGEPLIITNGVDWIRLYDEPCNHAGTLALLKPEWRAKFKKARAELNRATWFACWLESEGGVFLVFEDGDQARLDMAQFKRDFGV